MEQRAGRFNAVQRPAGQHPHPPDAPAPQCSVPAKLMKIHWFSTPSIMRAGPAASMSKAQRAAQRGQLDDRSPMVLVAPSSRAARFIPATISAWTRRRAAIGTVWQTKPRDTSQTCGSTGAS
ncbi:hypothetical protein CG51_08625 [Haematobacter missouriensis]|nr:hypothetical protein CG51_08625 [Haematobacter missouriensis]